MDFADDVTYSVHDLEDFYLAGLIPLRAITREEPEFGKLIDEWLNKLPNNNFKEQIKTIEEQNRLKNLLEAYIPPRYTPGSIEQIA
jgi:dGTPase